MTLALLQNLLACVLQGRSRDARQQRVNFCQLPPLLRSRKRGRWVLGYTKQSTKDGHVFLLTRPLTRLVSSCSKVLSAVKVPLLCVTRCRSPGLAPSSADGKTTCLLSMRLFTSSWFILQDTTSSAGRYETEWQAAEAAAALFTQAMGPGHVRTIAQALANKGSEARTLPPSCIRVEREKQPCCTYPAYALCHLKSKPAAHIKSL